MSSIRATLDSLGIRPKKGLGQNFLVDPTHLQRIVDAAELGPEDTVLEIGPGLGALTDLLAEQAGRVIAVELDRRVIQYLRERYCTRSHITIVEADILAVDAGTIVAQATQREDAPYSVVANLPYYITANAVRHLLEGSRPPELLVLTVQREVAERMVAGPPEMSLLALGVQYYCDAEIVDRIPAGSFYPVPKVDSAVVRMRRRAELVQPEVSSHSFFATARAGFSQARKQLRNSLAAGIGISPAMAASYLEAAGVDSKRRAETLSLQEWATLAQIVAAQHNQKP